MISLFKHVYNLFDYDYQKEQYSKKFEEENQHFNTELEKEEPLYEKADDQITKTENEVVCSLRSGVITSLRSNNGTIDNSLFFDVSVCGNFHELSVGCIVKYLEYNSPHSDHLKVVKVELAQESQWDAAPTDKEIRDAIESLQCAEAEYFNTHLRSVLGIILSRNRQFLTVDTDYNEITVNLDDVKIEFIPKEGDRVSLDCKMQTDEHFADLAGEVLETISVYPARTKREHGTVTKVHEDWGIINSDCYYTTDSLESEMQLNVGDLINADMIECERGIFLWRCLKIELLERAQVQNVVQQKPEQIENTNPPISVTSEIRFVFDNAFESQQQQIEIRNNSDRVHKLLRLHFIGNRKNSQLKFDDITAPLALQPGKSEKFTLYCESKFYGLAKERLVISFGSFKIFRHIEISVGVNEDKENANNSPTKNIRSRNYANQVWSKKGEIIPGVRTFTLRRFVANRIPSFEVPQRLRSALLMDCSREEQIAKVMSIYPSVTKDLDIYNYVNRFQTLLHIEEIEQFVNFRQFDRDRAHFTREGEYLALTIENLAEKRPSLVLGDIVRATNPWAEEEENRIYEGCIHKVMCNKILLKFNAAFQRNYNGEDYHLEFFFSRFNFRKQHYATQKIAQKRGEHFLFPSKIQLSEKLQLDVTLDKGDNLMFKGKPLARQWCNPNLNAIQKVAIVNILRAEAKAMPYVIFGPPGTGKTITMVETIIQMIIQMPNSRILVATPSNSSADLIASRLIDSGVLNPGDFVRLVSQNIIDKDLIPDHLKQYCSTVDIGIDGTTKDSMITTESGMKLRCQMKHLGRHKITIGTCATLGAFHQMNFPKNHFTHVVIDESGQCTEPEIMVPISLLSPNSGQIILAGDPLQLGPLVVNIFAGKCGLSTSFLERLVARFPYKRDKIRFAPTGYDPRLVTKLIYNYRALPSILRTYNRIFYDSELVPMIQPEGSREFSVLESIRSLLWKSNTRPASHAAFFHGMRGENKRDCDSPSWYNPIEAKQVFIMIIQLYRLKISPNQIGIITPYQKQVRTLRSIFAEADVVMPKIGTVEEFQGQERDIVLVSTVRSSKDFLKIDLKFALGFASSPKRMNVVISRPRALLYVCGNPHLLSLTDTWKEFIQYCVDNDAYTGCDLPDNIKTLETAEQEVDFV